MPEYNITFDWNRITTIGKVKILAEQVVGAPSQEAITQAVEDYIEAHPGSLSPLSPAVKSALLQIAEKVAYIDEHGQDYYDALDAALSAKALLQITAVYTQTGTVYDTDSLDSLKADLVVTAYYDDGSTGNVTAASELSGTLTEGTSTITATYGGKSATFNVTVSGLPIIRVFVGKGTSGTTIINNANRALSEPIPFTNEAPISIQWDGYSADNAKLSFKNTTSNVNTIDSTGIQYVPETSIGETASGTQSWLETTEKRVFAKAVNNVWVGLTFSTTSGYGRLLFAGAQDMSAPIPSTISGNVTIKGVTYRLVETPITDFE